MQKDKIFIGLKILQYYIEDFGSLVFESFQLLGFIVVKYFSILIRS